MADQDIIRLLKQTRDLLAFHQALGLDELPLSTALGNFLEGPASQPSRKSPAASGHRKASPPAPDREPKTAPPAVSLAEVRTEAAACRQCPGGEAKRISVSGGTESGLMVIVDPPAAGDSAAPVAGPADELLTKMLAAIGLARETVYVTPLLKCSLDREPAPRELENCLSLLRREIAAVAPRVICAMGPLAAATLLRSKKSIIALRGRFQSFQELPLMPTFHPAFLLTTPEMKKAAWLDLQAISKRLARRW